MKKILLALVIAFEAFGVTQDSVWSVPHGSTLPKWQTPLPTTAGGTGLGSGPTFYKFSGNTFGWGISDLPGVVSAAPSTNGLMLVRGGTGAGVCTAVSNSEGYSASGTNLGSGCTFTFSIAFQETPICTISPTTGAGAVNCTIGGASTTAINAICSSNAGATFICIGQRNSSN